MEQGGDASLTLFFRTLSHQEGERGLSFFGRGGPPLQNKLPQSQLPRLMPLRPSVGRRRQKHVGVPGAVVAIRILLQWTAARH